MHTVFVSLCEVTHDCTSSFHTARPYRTHTPGSLLLRNMLLVGISFHCLLQKLIITLLTDIVQSVLSLCSSTCVFFSCVITHTDLYTPTPSTFSYMDSCLLICLCTASPTPCSLNPLRATCLHHAAGLLSSYCEFS